MDAPENESLTTWPLAKPIEGLAFVFGVGKTPAEREENPGELQFRPRASSRQQTHGLFQVRDLETRRGGPVREFERQRQFLLVEQQLDKCFRVLGSDGNMA